MPSAGQVEVNIEDFHVIITFLITFRYLSFTMTIILDNMNTVLIKQDPVMVANHKDEPPDTEDLLLKDSFRLFDSRYCVNGELVFK